MNESTVAPKRTRRRFLLTLLILLLAGAGAVAYFEGPLWAELSFAADETFPDDENWDSKRVRVDIQRNLNAYSPKRLSRYLYSPSERWRALVCIALSTHPETDPDKWAGVPALLVRTAVNTGNPGLRNLCLQAFRSVPKLEAADVENVLATLGVREAPEMKGILDRLAARGGAEPKVLSPVLAEWLNGESDVRRNAAFQLAVQHNPDLDDACITQFRKVLETSKPNDKPWQLIRILINRNPGFGEKLLKSDVDDRRILWQALATRTGGGQAAPSGMNGPSAVPTAAAPDLPPGGKTEQAVFIEGAEEAAAKELKTATGADRDLLIAFLLTRPNGFNTLMSGIDSRPDDFVQTVFEKFPAAQTALSRGYKRLGEKEAEAFVAVLPRLKGDARQRWGELMSIVGRPQGSRLFPAAGGPADPKHAATFAKLLANDESALWVESYFENVAPLPEADVGRIVAILKRGLAAHSGPLPPPQPPGPPRPVAAPAPSTATAASPGGGAPRSSAGMSAAAAEAALFRYASLLRKKFPTHPAVVAFFKEFPKVEQEISKAPPSTPGRTNRQ